VVKCDLILFLMTLLLPTPKELFRKDLDHVSLDLIEAHRPP
jgi:hypothetical protein